MASTGGRTLGGGAASGGRGLGRLFARGGSRLVPPAPAPALAPENQGAGNTSQVQTAVSASRPKLEAEARALGGEWNELPMYNWDLGKASCEPHSHGGLTSRAGQCLQGILRHLDRNVSLVLRLYHCLMIRQRRDLASPHAILRKPLLDLNSTKKSRDEWRAARQEGKAGAKSGGTKNAAQRDEKEMEDDDDDDDDAQQRALAAIVGPGVPPITRRGTTDNAPSEEEYLGTMGIVPTPTKPIQSVKQLERYLVRLVLAQQIDVLTLVLLHLNDLARCAKTAKSFQAARWHSLSWASGFCGRFEIAQCVLDRGASSDFVLRGAVQGSHDSLVRWLLGNVDGISLAQADVDSRRDSTSLPHMAVHALATAARGQGKSACCPSRRRSRDLVIRVLVALFEYAKLVSKEDDGPQGEGLLVNKPDPFPTAFVTPSRCRGTLLHLAGWLGEFELLVWLLEQGADPNLVNSFLESALFAVLDTRAAGLLRVATELRSKSSVKSGSASAHRDPMAMVTSPVGRNVISDVLFRPPECKFEGNFSEACALAGVEPRKYILLNILESNEFVSGEINRDLWGNDVIRGQVDAFFVLYQEESGTQEGKQLLHDFGVTGATETQPGDDTSPPRRVLPFLAILDPVTRRAILEIHPSKFIKESRTEGPKLRLDNFSERLTDFIDRHGAFSGSSLPSTQEDYISLKARSRGISTGEMLTILTQDYGVAPDAKEIDGRTPAHVAAASGNYEGLLFLKARAPHLFQKNGTAKAGATEPPSTAGGEKKEATWVPKRLLIHEAAMSQAPDVRILRLLLECDGVQGGTSTHEDHVDALDPMGQSALFLAVSAGQAVDFLEYLLEKGADPNLVVLEGPLKDSPTSVVSAALRARHSHPSSMTDTLDLLVSYGARLRTKSNGFGTGSITIAHIAASEGSYEGLLFIAKHEPMFLSCVNDTIMGQSRTVLHCVAAGRAQDEDQLKMAKLLLSSVTGANDPVVRRQMLLAEDTGRRTAYDLAFTRSKATAKFLAQAEGRDSAGTSDAKEESPVA